MLEFFDTRTAKIAKPTIAVATLVKAATTLFIGLASRYGASRLFKDSHFRGKVTDEKSDDYDERNAENVSIHLLRPLPKRV